MQISGIEINHLIQAATKLQENIVTNENELQVPVTPNLVRKTVKIMPAMYLKNIDKSLFINLHEFVLTPGAFELILLQDEDESDEEETEIDIEINESNLENSRQKGKGDQPSIVSKFLQIVNEVAEFIKQHGFSAQNRRRTETGYSSGVTAKQIQEHFYSTYLDLKQHKLSLSIIRRMSNAPNKHFQAADRYKALVNVKVGTKQNSCREFQP